MESYVFVENNEVVLRLAIAISQGSHLKQFIHMTFSKSLKIITL